MTLAPDRIERLTRLCGMFGSASDGERANAAMMADRLVRGSGATWEELLEPLKSPLVPVQPVPPASCLRHRADAYECLAVPDLWSEQERDFLVNMTRRRKGPSPKQSVWLADMLDRARARKAAA